MTRDDWQAYAGRDPGCENDGRCEEVERRAQVGNAVRKAKSWEDRERMTPDTVSNLTKC
jgi:hypothetical protein